MIISALPQTVSNFSQSVADRATDRTTPEAYETIPGTRAVLELGDYCWQGFIRHRLVPFSDRPLIVADNSDSSITPTRLAETRCPSACRSTRFTATDSKLDSLAADLRLPCRVEGGILAGLRS
jgi:hypothetical protein